MDNRPSFKQKCGWTGEPFSHGPVSSAVRGVLAIESARRNLASRGRRADVRRQLAACRAGPRNPRGRRSRGGTRRATARPAADAQVVGPSETRACGWSGPCKECTGLCKGRGRTAHRNGEPPRSPRCAARNGAMPRAPHCASVSPPPPPGASRLAQRRRRQPWALHAGVRRPERASQSSATAARRSPSDRGELRRESGPAPAPRASDAPTRARRQPHPRNLSGEARVHATPRRPRRPGALRAPRPRRSELRPPVRQRPHPRVTRGARDVAKARNPLRIS